jgi:hypothetical protein
VVKLSGRFEQVTIIGRMPASRRRCMDVTQLDPNVMRASAGI